MQRTVQRSTGSIANDTAEFLADISTRHSAAFQDRRQQTRDAAHRQELRSFVDAISQPAYSAIGERPGRDESKAFAEAISGRDALPLREAGWDASKHPRRGGPPNAGWWAAAGNSSSSTAPAPPPRPLHGDGGFVQAKDERVQTKIGLSGGKNWSGGGVLDTLDALAPGLNVFVKRHVTLARRSSGESGPETIVRNGENGPKLSAADGDLDAPGHKTIHVHVPEDWNDAQVAKYIVDQLADDSDAHRLVAHWATDHPELFQELRDKRFRNGLETIANIAQGYYGALAGLAPGGGLAVAAWDIQNGDNLGAALGAAFSLPFGKFAKAGGKIAIRAGEELVAILPIESIKRIKRMRPERKALLHKQLAKAETKEDAARIAQEFLKIPMDIHHPLPKFLGGEADQRLKVLHRNVHVEFHAELRKELEAAGFTLPVGAKRGSTKKWAAHLVKNPGAQKRAFDAVVKASKTIDRRHKTKLFNTVKKNIDDKSFVAFP